MNSINYLTLVVCMAAMSACSKDFDNSTVKEFELSRYLGVCYEIARYDQNCKGWKNYAVSKMIAPLRPMYA